MSSITRWKKLLNRKLDIIRISSLIRNTLKNQFKFRKAAQPSKASQNTGLDSKRKWGELKRNRKRNIKLFKLILINIFFNFQYLN